MAAPAARNKCETWNYVSSLQILPSSTQRLTSAPLRPQQSQYEKILYFVEINRQQGQSVINLTNRKIRMTFTNQKVRK